MISRQIKLYTTTVNAQAQNISLQLDDAVGSPKFVVNNYNQIVDWLSQVLGLGVDVTCYYAGRNDIFDVSSFIEIHLHRNTGTVRIYTVIIDGQTVAIGVKDTQVIGTVLRHLEKMNKRILGVETHHCDEKLLKLYPAQI